MRCYLDVILKSPATSKEDREERLKELEEKSQALTDWPEIL